MTHTLVTFLGRTPRLQSSGYRRATYRFPDGTETRTAFFGLALADHLAVDRVVVLGTKASMWSVLVEGLADEGQDAKRDIVECRDHGEIEDDAQTESVRLELADAEESGSASQSLLDRVEPIMTSAVGRDILPRVIPLARDTREQYEILQQVADTVTSGSVSFDLTHGFRHLGMVGFMSAFMLERVRDLEVVGLWYGALDMTDQEADSTPVLRLDGLTHVRRWVDALDRFDSNGDYGVFAPLLVNDGVPQDKARCLEKAAFFERILNLSAAAQQLTSFLPVLEQPLAGASELFRQRLADRLAWARQVSLAEHQKKLAFEHLRRGDLMRSAIFGWEALVTQQCDLRGYTAGDYYQGRKPAIDEFENALKIEPRRSAKRNAFHQLKTIRNTVAHGNPPNSRDRAMFKDAARLRAELEGALKCLLNGLPDD